VRRTVLAAALVLAVAGGVFLLREATQNRPDPVVDGSRTTIEFTVDTNRFARGEPVAATTLWSVCSATVGGAVSAAPLPVADDRWRVTVEPAIGKHGRARLVGCIEDVTIDRILGHVASLTSTP
jgi:hypothetical protein